MAVRERQDRRLGLDPEKLLTLEEAARRLGVPADDVRSLIQTGKLSAFQLGGKLLRLRPSDVEGFRLEREGAASSAKTQERYNRPGRLHLFRRKATRPAPTSFWDRVFDFFYFNDFYLVAFLILLTLVAIIFAL